MGYRGKKAQKKFEAKKLGGEIKKRKFKQKVARSQDKRAVRQEDEPDKENDDDHRYYEDEKAEVQRPRKARKIEGVNLHDFTEKGFLHNLNEGDEEGDEGDEGDEEEGEDEEEEGEEDEEGEEEEEEEDEEEGEEEEGENDEGNEEGAEEDQQLAHLAKSHKKQLKSIEQSDPEFFEFLKQNDPGLLHFGDDLSSDEGEQEDEEGGEGEGEEEEGGDDEDGEEEEEEDEMDSDAEEEERARRIMDGEESESGSESENEFHMGGSHELPNTTSNPTLTLSRFQQWRTTLHNKRNPSSLRRVLLAFQSVCGADADDAGDARGKGKRGKGGKGGKGGKRGEGREPKLNVADSRVFAAVVKCCTNDVPEIIDSALNLDTIEGTSLPQTSSSFKAWQGVIKQYLITLTRFVGGVDGSQEDMQQFMIAHTQRMAPYYACFPVVARKLVKMLLPVWGQTKSQRIRVGAFLAMRKLALSCRYPFLELTLKGMYLTFARCAAKMNQRSLEAISMMKTCIVEMCGIDVSATYQHAFVYLRQLAVHLRNALTARTKEACRQVYCWQYFNCLDVWTAVLCEHARANDDIKLLVFPLTQVLLGCVQVVPTPRYFPLRIRVGKMVSDLCRALKVYVPLPTVLLEILACADFRKAPTSGRLDRFQFDVNLKASKAIQRTRVYQDILVAETLSQLVEFLSAFADSIAFPELAIPVVAALKIHAKEMNVVRFRKQIAGLVDKVVQQQRWVEGRRSKVQFGVKDVDDAKALLSGVDAQADVRASPLMVHYKSVVEGREMSRKARANHDDHDDESDEDDEDESDDNQDQDDDGSDVDSEMDEPQDAHADGKQKAKGKGKGKGKDTGVAAAPRVSAKRRQMLGHLAKELSHQRDTVQDFDLDGF